MGFVGDGEEDEREGEGELPDGPESRTDVADSLGEQGLGVSTCDTHYS